MRRRAFLLGIASLATAHHATAQMKMDGMGHDMSGGDMRGPTGSALVLPEGEPLRELPRLANLSNSPGVFSARLTAGPATAQFATGLETPVLAYNGSIPGPLIEVNEGDRVEIEFVNEVPKQDSTIHWHGMPVPSLQDGNPMDPVRSGSSRVYAFDLPTDSAASYWYHPHPHGRTAEQVYRGLAGVFLVKPKTDPIPTEYGDTVLMLTDLRLAADGTIPDSTMADHMNGRVGDHVLVNGQKNPSLAVNLGQRRRIRLCNATNARFLRLTFENAGMQLIGTDGGLIEAAVAVDEFLLTPGERVELIVTFEKAGAAVLRTLDYDRGWMGMGKPDDAGLALLTANVTGPPVAIAPTLPGQLRSIASLGEAALTRRFVFTESMEMGAGGMKMNGHDMQASSGDMATGSDRMRMTFLINGVSFDRNRIDIVAKVGVTELWELINQADMDHPFHVHGTQFQIVEHERGGKATKSAFPSWKDTVNVARGETVRLVLRQDQVGRRMYHCHILEHEDLGMMGVVDVQA